MTRNLPARPLLPLAILLTLCALAALPAGASASGWHWTRTFVYGGATGTAHGSTCSSSRFSDWRWRGTVHTGGDTYRFRWIERIRHNGAYRHLHYTYANSTAWNDLSATERDAIRSAVITGLNQTEVSWFDHPDGRQFLQYKVNHHEQTPVLWRPLAGC